MVPESRFMRPGGGIRIKGELACWSLVCALVRLMQAVRTICPKSVPWVNTSNSPAKQGSTEERSALYLCNLLILNGIDSASITDTTGVTSLAQHTSAEQ